MKEKLVDTIFDSAIDDPSLLLHQIILHSDTIFIEKYQCHFQYTISLPFDFIHQNRKMPLLIIFHGTPGGVDQSILLLHQCFSEEIRQTFPILLFSRIGYLGSQSDTATFKEYQWELQADILEEFLMRYLLFQETNPQLQQCASLINNERVIICGVSGGVAPALTYARKFNRKCLGFISISAYFPLPVDWTMILWPYIHSVLFRPSIYHFLFSYTLRWSLKCFDYFRKIFSWFTLFGSIKGDMHQRAHLAEQHYYKPPVQTALLRFCITNGILKQRRLGHWNDIQQFYNKYQRMEEWIKTNASQVSCPSIVFHDKLDSNAPYHGSQVLYQHLHQCEYCFTESSGHLMMLVEGETIQHKLDRFLLQTIHLM